MRHCPSPRSHDMTPFDRLRWKSCMFLRVAPTAFFNPFSAIQGSFFSSKRTASLAVSVSIFAVKLMSEYPRTSCVAFWTAP